MKLKNKFPNKNKFYRVEIIDRWVHYVHAYTFV